MTVSQKVICTKSIKSFVKDEIYFTYLIDWLKYKVLNPNDSIICDFKVECSGKTTCENFKFL